MPQEWSARTIVTCSPSTSWVPPRFMPEQPSTPLPSSQAQISKLATTFRGRCCLASSTASPMWSKWAWVTSIASRRWSCLQLLGAGRVAVHPGVDEQDLAAGQLAVDGGVAELGELGSRVLVHASPPQSRAWTGDC